MVSLFFMFIASTAIAADIRSGSSTVQPSSLIATASVLGWWVVNTRDQYEPIEISTSSYASFAAARTQKHSHNDGDKQSPIALFILSVLADQAFSTKTRGLEHRNEIQHVFLKKCGWSVWWGPHLVSMQAIKVYHHRTTTVIYDWLLPAVVEKPLPTARAWFLPLDSLFL